MIKDLSEYNASVSELPLNSLYQLNEAITKLITACDYLKALPSRYNSSYIKLRVQNRDPDSGEVSDITTQPEAAAADFILYDGKATAQRLLDCAGLIYPAEGISFNDIAESVQSAINAIPIGE